MKQLILGNEAVARGLYEAGCMFVSSYPGTPSTEITEAIAKYPEVYAEWAPNEKVAMEAAFGASLAGRRSFCGMKHVGLNVAADPLFTISYTGVNAGMLIGVAMFYITPEFIGATSIMVAIVSGGVSGLAATGSNQVLKQLMKSAEDGTLVVTTSDNTTKPPDAENEPKE